MTTLSNLESTIKADLQAGISWLEDEVSSEGLALWNILKGAFIALEPAASKVLIDALQVAVATAGTGASIEAIETAVLNAATAEVKAVLAQTGSGIVQTIIAGLKATL